MNGMHAEASAVDHPDPTIIDFVENLGMINCGLASASPKPLCCLAILPHRPGEPGRELINLTFQAPNQGGDHACTE
jgi:hypothetical protein